MVEEGAEAHGSILRSRKKRRIAFFTHVDDPVVAVLRRDAKLAAVERGDRLGEVRPERLAPASEDALRTATAPAHSASVGTSANRT